MDTTYDRAALQRLDLSDPRRALEELTRVPAIAARAMAAVDRLDAETRASYAVESQQGQQERRQKATDEARDTARRLLAEVLL